MASCCFYSQAVWWLLKIKGTFLRVYKGSIGFRVTKIRGTFLRVYRVSIGFRGFRVPKKLEVPFWGPPSKLRSLCSLCPDHPGLRPRV